MKRKIEPSKLLSFSSQDVVKMYLDYFNNFLTVERFAEYYNLSISDAKTVIYAGRNIHNNPTNI
jgi:hypothetical protein